MKNTKPLLEQENDKEIQEYLNSEEERLKTLISNDNRIKSTMSDPDERAIKEKTIKLNKERLENLQSAKEKFDKLKFNSTNKNQQVKNFDITSTIKEELRKIINTPKINTSVTKKTPKQKAVLVKFDTKTKTPFNVKFSQRGFSIDGTRLSFEILEDALSKEYNITLNRGDGLNLDAVKMQKILKYKDLF